MPNNFVEDPQGNIWLLTGMNQSQIVIYDGDGFSTRPWNEEAASMLFDLHGNLFMAGSYMNVGSKTARVLWYGDTFSFDPGKWLDEYTYQAGYFFTARIPQGQYQVGFSGLYGLDGIEAAPFSGGTFKVDFAGQVTEITPPPAPAVTAGGSKADPSLLKAAWSVTDLHQQVDGYRYAIGTSQGGADVIYWTTTSQAKIERANLPLVNGKTYWISVQAHNQAGLWGASGYASFTAGKDGVNKLFLPLGRKQ